MYLRSMSRQRNPSFDEELGTRFFFKMKSRKENEPKKFITCERKRMERIFNDSAQILEGKTCFPSPKNVNSSYMYDVSIFFYIKAV